MELPLGVGLPMIRQTFLTRSRYSEGSRYDVSVISIELGKISSFFFQSSGKESSSFFFVGLHRNKNSSLDDL